MVVIPIVIAVLELNIHGLPFLVNGRDLTEEVTSRERETVIINRHLYKEHVPCVRTQDRLEYLENGSRVPL